MQVSKDAALGPAFVWGGNQAKTIALSSHSLSLSLSHSMSVCGWVGGELMIACFQQYFLKVLITVPLP